MKDFLALLRLVANPRDELSWFRVLQLLEGVGPVRARRVVERLTRDDVPRGGLAAALLDVGDALPAAAHEPAVTLLCALDARGRRRSARAARARACARALAAAARGALRRRRGARRGRRPARGGVRRRGLHRAASRPSSRIEPPSSSADLARPAAPGRGVPRALDGALGEGPGVGRRARARAVGRALPERHGADRPRGAGGGAPPVLRRPDAGAPSAPPVRADALLPPPAGDATTCTATARPAAS